MGSTRLHHGHIKFARLPGRYSAYSSPFNRMDQETDSFKVAVAIYRSACTGLDLEYSQFIPQI